MVFSPNKNTSSRIIKSATPGAAVFTPSSLSAALLSIEPPVRQAVIRSRTISAVSASKTCASRLSIVCPGAIPSDARRASRSQGAVKSGVRPASSRTSLSSSPPPKYRRTFTRNCACDPEAISSNTALRIRAAVRSSISLKLGLTPASSGKRRRMLAQNEWIVWIFKPPGVSIARANNRRAADSLSGAITPSTPRFARSLRSALSSSIAQPPRRLNNRFCISAAAAFV